MTSHTPGPWHGVDGPNGSAYIIVGKTRVIASLSAHPTPGLVKANARLIAAAPEMLEVMKAVEKHYEGEWLGSAPQWLGPMRAAIAKATTP